VLPHTGGVATPSQTLGDVWTPTRAFGRAVLLTGMLIMLAVALGRLDLVALATPFAIGVAWSLRARPYREPVVAIGVPTDPAAEGGPTQAALTVVNPNPIGLDLVVVRMSHSPWVSLRHSDRPYGTDLGPRRSLDIAFPGTANRWGSHEIGPATAYGVACDALLLSTTASAPAGRIRVHPLMPPFRADETMPRASALVGVHRSRRPGEGGELAGVRRYGSGDRLRRVDWRVTLRTRELHVAHTLSDRDAEVVVLVDVLHEAGQSGGIHGAATVVDTTVRAAAAITEHYLRQGDRVGLLEYSGQPRVLRAAGGRRQLQAALEWLLRTRASAGAGDPPVFGIDPHLIPGSALVVVLTPMLGPQSADMIAQLARAGRVVVAIDTLGDMALRPIVGSQWTNVARRLWRMERDNIIGQLREVGVPVTAWVGAGSLDQVLREMTRMAAAPRIVIR
jgi:uncharacterized protein (DUF58 family)